MGRRKLGIPVFKQVTVPGGSRWNCHKCGRRLEAGEKAAKGGSVVFCSVCVQGARK